MWAIRISSVFLMVSPLLTRSDSIYQHERVLWWSISSSAAEDHLLKVVMKIISLRFVSLVFYDYCHSHPSKHGYKMRIFLFSNQASKRRKQLLHARSYFSKTLNQGKKAIFSWNMPQRLDWKPSPEEEAPPNPPISLVRMTFWNLQQECYTLPMVAPNFTVLPWTTVHEWQLLPRRQLLHNQDSKMFKRG